MVTNQSINDMTSVRVIARDCPLPSDEVHDLVLAFSGHAGIRNYYFQLQVCVNIVRDIMREFLPVSNPDRCSSFALPNIATQLQVEP